MKYISAKEHMRHEIKIEILAPDYVDDLIVCLARQGYSPYIDEDGDVHFTVDGEDMHEIKEE